MFVEVILKATLFDYSLASSKPCIHIVIVDYRKSDSTTNDVLQPNVVPISIADAIRGTRTAS